MGPVTAMVARRRKPQPSHVVSWTHAVLQVLTLSSGLLLQGCGVSSMLDVVCDADETGRCRTKSCERAGYLKTLRTGDVQGVVRVAFARPDNLSSDWRNLVFLIGNVQAPFVVDEDDGEKLSLLVYVDRLDDLRTDWLASSCSDETDFGAQPSEVWAYQLSPSDPGARGRDYTLDNPLTDPNEMGVEYACNPPIDAPVEEGCGLSMLPDPAVAESAWTLILQSTNHCDMERVDGRLATISQPLALAEGTYHVQGIFGMDARYIRSDVCAAKEGTSPSPSLSTAALFVSDSSSSVAYIKELQLHHNDITASTCRKRVPEAPFETSLEVTRAGSRLYLEVGAEPCVNSMVSLTHLRMYRLPNTVIESYFEDGDALR